MTAEIHEIARNSSKIVGQLFRTEIDERGLVVVATGDSSSGSKSATYAKIIPSLTGLGFSVFMFDFRGQGLSPGSYEDLTVEAGIEDMGLALDYVFQKNDIETKRIGFFGSSFGGCVAVNFAATCKFPIAAMALKSPAVFYPETYETYMGMDKLLEWELKGEHEDAGRPWSAYLDGFKFNGYNAALEVDVPTLITHGDADEIVPLRQSERLRVCLGGNSELVVLPGVGHGYKEGDALEQATALYADWFNKHMK